MSQVNPFVIYGFFDLLRKTVDELKLREKPQQIFNLDETSFCHDPKKTKVVGAVGVRSTRMISSAGRENTSVLICTSATGQKLPPLVIFKGKNIIESWISKNVKNETAYAASKRGWMESTIFLNRFKKCFLPNIPQDRPILLIYDGHATHINPDLCKLALENGVHILKLPPHTTHVLQPLDVTVFGPFKTDWDKQLVKWQRQNPRKRIPKQDFVELLNKVYDCVSIDNIQSGFIATGIYDANRLEVDLHPVNENAVKESIFRPDDLKRYKDQKINQPSSLETNEQTQSSNSDLVPDIAPPAELFEPEQGPSSSTNIQELNNNNISQHATEDTVEQNALPLSNNSDLQSKSFDDILLGLVRSSKQNSPVVKRRRICSGAEIITTKEYIEKLEEQEKTKEKKGNDREKRARKNEKRVVKPVQTKKRKYALSSSSSEDSTDIKDFAGSSEEEVSETVEVIPEDFVIVNYDGDYYPGQVISIEEGSVRVKHMYKCAKINAWRWPDKEDYVDYSPEDILKIIKKPIEKNKRNMFNVPEMERFLN